MEFEDDILKKWYTAVFSIVPLHIIIMTAGLLCSNHVTYRFGKGMMPKAYRLSLQSMGVIMDQYAQYVSPSLVCGLLELFADDLRFLSICDFALVLVRFCFLLDNSPNNTVTISRRKSSPGRSRHRNLGLSSTPRPKCPTSTTDRRVLVPA